LGTSIKPMCIRMKEKARGKPTNLWKRPTTLLGRKVKEV